MVHVDSGCLILLPLAKNNLWFGVVEDIFDPEEDGRVRVRIYGIHTEDKQLLPTESLPWAKVFLPANNPSISGKGLGPNGLLQGSGVSGIFLDGMSYQEPVVLFSTPGKRKKNKNIQFGFNDPKEEYPLESTDSDVNNKIGQSHRNDEDVAKNRSENRSDPEPVDETPDPFEKPKENQDSKYPSTPWMDIAQGDLGVNEEKNAARIKEYHKKGGGVAFGETVAWCASFVNFCLAEAKVKGTRSAMARSFTNYGVDVKSTLPFGAILVLQGSRGASSGHVAFVTADKGDRIEAIGGNQTTGGGKKYDTGGQVTKTTFPKSWIVAVRFPKGSDEKKEPKDSNQPGDPITEATSKK